MPSSRRALIVAAALTAATGISVAPSSAEDNSDPGPVTEHGSTVTITLSSTTSTQYKDGGGGNTGGSYTIPPCWYQSVGGSSAFQSLLDRYKQGAHGTSDPKTNDWQLFLNWLNPWEKALGLAEADNPPGTWYQAGCADWASTEAQTWSQSNPDFVYVGPNKPMPVGVTIINPLTLAQYALKSTMLPPPAPKFSPAATGPSFVNLTTWAWQDGGKTLNLTATAGPQSATVLMTPTAMTLTTNGPTASGIPTQCLNVNGMIGVPWTPDAAANPSTPGCGVKFTAPGVYTIHAEGTWKITWTSPQVVGVQTLPDVHLATDTQITAREVQSIN